MKKCSASSNAPGIGKGTDGGFRSKYEQRIYANALSDGLELLYEPTKFKYLVPAGRGALCKSCGSRDVRKPSTYIPDFLLRGGTYVEAKGRLSSANRTRLVAFKAEKPSVCVKLLFQRDNWLTKKQLKRYSDWAKENGFDYAIGERIPADWFVGAAADSAE